MSIVPYIFFLFQAHLDRLRVKLYRKGLPERIAALRKKDKIRVLFMVSSLPMWKTKGLYLAMKNHPRFDVMIGTALITNDLPSEAIIKYQSLIEYLRAHDFPYKEMYGASLTSLHPDIIFYQQPYDGFIATSLCFHSIKNEALICHITYGFATLKTTDSNKWMIDTPLHRYTWYHFMENNLTLVCGEKTLLKGSNMIPTGVPVQDELLTNKRLFTSPWKKQSKIKKRIIWAPHHSIQVDDKNSLNYSTFLEVYDYMFMLADKYNEQIQMAFKPHPFLKKKLYEFWGQEKTDAYYNKWASMENTQFEDGEYIALFKHSDALIHDCSTFQVEYCFMKKPCLFLLRPEKKNSHRDSLNSFSQMAFDLHNSGITEEDIESFIQQVIAGEDSRLQEREAFYNNFLLPPYGKSASENIINAILGEAEYKN